MKKIYNLFKTKTMKVKGLIKELQQIKDKEKELEILIGDDDNDYYTCSEFTLMHTLDDDEQNCIELFIHTENLYNLNTYENFDNEYKFNKETELKNQ
tara:strand:- start:296 stop:586 length:291 start_codon:yes stop_codon:yes gene_type:complete